PTTSTYMATPTTTTSYSYRVTDSAYSPKPLCSTGNLVTVSPTLAAGDSTPSTPSINSGQTITLSANSSGGTTPYHYQWYSGGSSICASDTALLGTTQTQSVSPAVNTYYCYSVTDSAFTPFTQSSATDLVSTDPILTAGPITPSSPAIDNGQTITLSANPTGGTAPYHYQWYQSTSLTCPYGNTLPSTTSTLSVSPSTNTYYCYTVTDSSTGSPAPSATSPATLVTVNPALIAGLVTPSSPTIDNGQVILLTANPLYGTTPYHYQWYSDGACTTAIASATTATYTASPSSSATYSYAVTDSAFSPISHCSSGDSITVNPALVPQAITPTSSTIDSGQTITLTAHSSGGTGTLAYQWYSDGLCTTTIVGGVGSNYQATPTVTSTYSYKVTDSSYTPASACSPPDKVTVNAPLFSGPITPAAPSIDAGQAINLTSHPSGGTLPFTYRWYSDGSCTLAIPGATSSFYATSPSVATTYSYSVTDSAYSPVSQCSPADVITVSPDLTAGGITPSAPTIDNGQSITLTSSASGGTQPYSYHWYSDGTCTNSISGATFPTYDASPSASTTYSYRVSDSANSPESKCSTADLITVNPALVAGTITPAAPTIDSGQSVLLTATPSGGTAPYSFQWYSGTSPNCSSDTAPLGTSSTQTVTSASSAYYCYKVTDGASGNPTTVAISSSDLVTVNSALTIPLLTAVSPIDNGQATTLTVSWSAGTSPYNVNLYTSTSSNSCTGLVQVLQNRGLTVTSTTFSQSPSSNTSYCASVTDSAVSAVTLRTTSPLTVTVNPALVVKTVSGTPPTIDIGQSSTLSATFSGGTSPYTCQWLQEGPSA